MTLLEKYYYETTEIDMPKSADEIIEMLKPILSWDLILEIDSLLSKAVSESGLYGFKEGFEVGKLMSKQENHHNRKALS